MASREDLFRALHDYGFTVADRTWRIEVYSIVDDDRRWLQLRMYGPSSVYIRVRVDAARSAEDIVTHLQQWLDARDQALSLSVDELIID